MRFRRHLRSWIHPQQHPNTRHPPLSTPRLVAVEFALPTSTPHGPHLLVTIDLVQRTLTPTLHPSQHESWQGSQCNAKASPEKSCVNSGGHPSYFSKALWSFVSETFHNLNLYMDSRLWRTQELEHGHDY